MVFRDVHEREVAGVEIAHRRDQGNGRLARQALAELPDRVNELGQKQCSAAGNVLSFTAFTYASIAPFTDGAPSMKFLTKRALRPG